MKQRVRLGILTAVGIGALAAGPLLPGVAGAQVPNDDPLDLEDVLDGNDLDVNDVIGVITDVVDLLVDFANG